MSNHPRTTLQRTTAGLILLSTIPIAKADCFIENGREICNGLSNGARAGIGIGIFVLAMVVIAILGVSRRRRMQRHNQTYITNPNPNTQHMNAANYHYNPNTTGQQGYAGGNYNTQSYDPTNAGQAPQYPPPMHTGGSFNNQNPPAGYNTQPYDQPQVYAPPQYEYAPPAGPPPPKA